VRRRNPSLGIRLLRRSVTARVESVQRRLAAALLEVDRLYAHLLRELRLVLPNLADHRLGCLGLEKNSTT
jgi:hypothetical protein